MKKILALGVFVCCLGILPAVAQKNNRSAAPSPNDSPAVKTKKNADAALAWKEFTSDRYDFWIDFPGDEKQVVEGSADEFHNFDVYTKKAHFGVAVKNMLVSLSNRQLEVLFESIVEETEDEKTRLVGNRDVYLDGILGKELIYEEGDRLVFGRFFVLERKLFVLTVDLARKDYDKNFDRAVKRFFDSFGVAINVKMDA